MTWDPIGVLEAAYDVDAPFAGWLKTLGTALLPLMGQGFGAIAYAVSTTGDQRFNHLVALDTAPGFELLPQAAAGSMDPADFAALYRFVPRIGWARGQVPPDIVQDYGVDAFFADTLARFGFDDVFALTASAPDAPLVQVTFPARRRRLEPRQLALFEQVAAHVEAGLRLRSHAVRTEAVLSPDGKVLHAEPDAQARRSISALTAAAERTTAARGSLRQEDPQRAIDLWTALVAGRWTIIDHVDTDGRRFLLAQRNDAAHPHGGLTVRECLVAGLTARGLPGKHVAYELGVAQSTVSSTLRAVLAKLGLHSRYELAAVFAQQPTTK